MVRIIENNELTRSERINLIMNIIQDLENKDINGITDSIVDIRNTYESTEEAVRDGYISYFVTYFENDEDGYDFVEKYYGDYTDTFYKELESACEKYVSTFSADVIEGFFDYDNPLNPGSMDSWINGTHRFTYKFPRYYESLRNTSAKSLNERAWSGSNSSNITLGQLALVTPTNEKIRIYDKASEDMIADGDYLNDVLLERPELENVEILYLNATGSKTLWVEIRL